MTRLANAQLIERLNNKPTVSLIDAAVALDVSPRTAYTLARDGHFPVDVVRVGSQWRVPSASLLRLLGLEVVA